jgi:hypothetical protein
MKNLIRALIISFILFGMVSCGDDDSNAVNYLIMEMKMVNLGLQDTIEYNFSYQDNQLKQATITSQNINLSYSASIDTNGKVTEAGDKRFEWEGDRLVKITDDNGIWIELSYNGDQLSTGELYKYDQNNEIAAVGSLEIDFSGQNLSGIESSDPTDQIVARHTYSGFDNKTYFFKAIWWFHYVGETLGAFRSGDIPEAFFSENNPGAYRYEAPRIPFERTINYLYTYDEQGRVILVEYEVGIDDYQLIVSY